jgi:uncharacterized membrane protein YkoI
MTNNKFSIKSVLKFSGGLILALVSQYTLADKSYQLPSSKLQMETCEREALALHAGEVEQERVFNKQDHFEVRHEIQANDGTEWAVLCDLATGKIIGEQKMLGDGQ